jgi:CRISPR/Cas system Type II protein with McrA/HNH and RuvC-like nuclease domain
MATRRISAVDRLFYKIDREKIWNAQGKKCKYCNSVISRKQATMDHIIPLSIIKRHSVTNCVVACDSCNQQKGSNVNWECAASNNNSRPLEHWEQMIVDFGKTLDERIKRFEYDLIATNTRTTKGSFSKWKRYWEKQGKWNNINS